MPRLHVSLKGGGAQPRGNAPGLSPAAAVSGSGAARCSAGESQQVISTLRHMLKFSPRRFIFYSVCFAAHPSYERQGGGQGVGKQTTYVLCVVQGGEGRGCGDRAAGSFPVARGSGEREKGIGE